MEERELARATFAVAVRRHLVIYDPGHAEANRIRESVMHAMAIATARARTAGPDGRARVDATAPDRVAAPLDFPRLGVCIGPLGGAELAQVRRLDAVVTESPYIAMDAFPTHEPAPAEPRSGTPWNVEALAADRLWQLGWTGAGVAVAHLDTGVDDRHELLRGAVKEFVHVDGIGVPTASAAQDAHGHGTFTAAVIGGRRQVGMHAGVAPDCDLYCARVIEGGDPVVRVLGGLQWARDRGARIINLSLGIRGHHPAWEAILHHLRRTHGMLPIAAVGNEGPGTSRSPGNYSDCLSIGAHDKARNVCSFSSGARRRIAGTNGKLPTVPDAIGPGEGVISAKAGSAHDYVTGRGTSIATAHVSGIAALLLQAYPHVDVDTLERALLDSCTPVTGTSRTGRAGHGIPDASKAIAVLRGSRGGPGARP